MTLKQLLHLLPAEQKARVIRQGPEGKINTVTSDSRQVCSGSVFVALKGSRHDGHTFIPQAVERGCSCVVVEDAPGVLPGVTVIQLDDSHAALGVLSAALQGFPASSMTMIGLTGTNGKTTVSWMIEQMLSCRGYQVGVIGTVNYRYPDRLGRPVVEPAPLTTPDPVLLQQLLAQMKSQGVTHVVMEASSHALLQKRLAGVLFDVGVFTNLSRDHLDFHGNMEDYFSAKKFLFTKYLKQDARAVIVTDQGGQENKWGQRLVQELEQKKFYSVLTCGFDSSCTVSAADLDQDIHGFSCRIGLAGQALPFRSRLTGRYNVLNVLASAGVGIALGLEQPERIVSGLQQVERVPGRLERVRLPGSTEGEQPCVLVDYAHTPDALHNVLQTLKSLAQRRVICIFGCGGDRDPGKRSMMGTVAAELADVSIVTSDNPRSEDPESILRAVVDGFRSASSRELTAAALVADKQARGYVTISKRTTAIYMGCSMAESGDIVLIAGKGHEDYQLLGQKRIFFDDRIEAVNGLLCWNTAHLLKATHGRVHSGRQCCLLAGVCTDSRQLARGDIFVALRGDNFDGHDYAMAAARAGAGALLVHHKVESLPDDVLVIQVDDTLQALGDLAAYRRRLLQGNFKIAALTGSSGKTTVKEMTAAIFSRHLQDVCTGIDPLLKTKGNFNNLIGLPLSLLPIAAGHRMAVLEMGMNRPGEIERLVEIADPDIGCITNVQAAHLEGLGSIEGVARAKGELLAGMRRDTIAVINLDNPYVRRLPRKSAETVGFAVTSDGRRHHPVVRATRITDQGEQGMCFTLHVADWNQRISVQVPGMHNVSNCAAAAAIAHAAGIAPETIVDALTAYRSVDKRMQFMTLPGGVQVLNDCYNANPASMAAALQTVSRFGTNCRRIALLGDMLELGDQTMTAHREVGRLVADLGYDHLVVTGSFVRHVVCGARDRGMAEGRIHVFVELPEISNWLYSEMVNGRLKEGDWVLLKGSRGMQMEGVLTELERCFETGITEER